MLRRLQLKSWQVFLFTFALLLALHWPAHDAGWVSDTLGWLDAVRHQSFADFINRRGFGVRSFYQTTQFATWSFYQLAGANRIAWHLLHIGLQALNAALLFAFFRRLLLQAEVRDAAPIALSAVLLFSLSPSLTEVIVWEAAFHYLQGLAFILIQLLLLQGYVLRQRARPAIIAAALYAVATFSLELFYLTPVFSLLLLAFYRYGKTAIDPSIVRRAARRFLLPQLALLAAHLLLIRLSLGTSTGRLGDGLWQHPLTYYAIKPPDYLLHLFGGRFLPQGVRATWHQFFCTYAGAGLFYAALAAMLSFGFFRYRRMGAETQVLSWAACAVLAAMGLVTPMWFPERLLVMGDRYLYTMLPFLSMALSIMIWRIGNRFLRNGVITGLLLASIAGTWQLARLWGRSELLMQQLQRNLPQAPQGKAFLLLNAPANYHGIPMIGAGPDGEFALMRRLVYPDLPPVAVAEAFAAEYTGSYAPLRVTNPEPLSCRVALADTTSRWWYEADYASTADQQGIGLRLRSQSEYEIRLNGAVQAWIPLIWTGREFSILTLDGR